MDVKNGFLNDDLDGEDYLKPPLGLEYSPHKAYRHFNNFLVNYLGFKVSSCIDGYHLSQANMHLSLSHTGLTDIRLWVSFGDKCQASSQRRRYDDTLCRQLNAGAFYEWTGAGPTQVRIEGLKNGTVNMSSYKWTNRIGLQGENLRIYDSIGLNGVNWVSTSEPPKEQPLTWYKAELNPPPGDEPIGLDMIHMGKGLAWLNGQEIGRYWPRKCSKHEECVQQCDYRGKFTPDKCSTGCGEPSQRWYHVPRSWFKPSGNILVIFEEIGGDPTSIQFSRRKISSVCSHISEDHPSFDFEHFQKDGAGDYNNKATVRLKCQKNTQISAVKFASFGNPVGTCGSYAQGECHDPSSISIVKKVCLNKTECALELTKDNFDMELCPGSVKKLAVEVVCT